MTPEQLIERIEKLMKDASILNKGHLIKARSLAAEAWRTRDFERRHQLICEAQFVMKGMPQ